MLISPKAERDEGRPTDERGAPDRAASRCHAAAARSSIASGQPPSSGVPGMPAARGGAVEVDGIEYREADEAHDHQPPRGAESPSGHAGAADHHRQEHEIAERVAQVGHDGRRADRPVPSSTTGKHDRGCNGGHGERSDRAVKPELALDAAEPPSQQDRHRDVAHRVEGDPEAVAERRDRDRLRVPERGRVIEVAERTRRASPRRGASSLPARVRPRARAPGRERRHRSGRRCRPSARGSPRRAAPPKGSCVCTAQSARRPASASSAFAVRAPPGA